MLLQRTGVWLGGHESMQLRAQPPDVFCMCGHCRQVDVLEFVKARRAAVVCMVGVELPTGQHIPIGQLLAAVPLRPLREAKVSRPQGVAHPRDVKAVRHFAPVVLPHERSVCRPLSLWRCWAAWILAQCRLCPLCRGTGRVLQQWGQARAVKRLASWRSEPSERDRRGI